MTWNSEKDFYIFVIRSQIVTSNLVEFFRVDRRKKNQRMSELCVPDLKLVISIWFVIFLEPFKIDTNYVHFFQMRK